MSWIRWPGLVAFLVIVGGGIAVTALCAGPVVKWAIESGGSRAVGAKVEVADAAVSLVPLGLTLTDLQVTNPDAPMTNAVQVDRLHCAVEPLPLVRRKVIIDAMQVTGVRFDTPRKVSGALPGRAAPTKAAPPHGGLGGGLALPGIDLPDPKTLLANEHLESLALAEQLQHDVQDARAQWQERLATLPGKERLADYRTRLDGLQAAEKDPQALLALRDQLVGLQRDLRADMKGLEEAKGALQGEVATLRERAAALRTAPQADVARLKEKYALSSKGIGNVTRALFGNRIGGWVETALTWYQRLSPYLERPATSAPEKPEGPRAKRAGGVDVYFREHQPSPDFLIRLANVSVVLPAGTVAGEIHDITPDQDRLGRPLTFDFAADALQGMDGVTLTGALNRTHPGNPRDTAHLTVHGYRAANVDLVQSDALHLALEEARSDLDLRADLRGPAVTATASAALDGVQFATTTAGGGALAKSVAAALADVHRFRLEGELSGTVADPALQITSDLDRVLRDAIGKQVAAHAKEFETRLTAEIDQRLAGPLAAVQKQVGDLAGLDGDLQGRLKEGNVLSAEAEKRLKEVAAGKLQEKLGSPLKEQLKGKLPGF